MFRTCFRFSAALLGLALVLTVGGVAQAKNSRLITQSTSSDCGPAALATLLTYYLDIPSTEAEIIRLANAEPVRGTSLQGLENAVDAKGGGAQSVRMTYATLQEQLKSYAAPVIVRLLLPEPHFVLVFQTGDEIAITDPAAGHVWLKREAFLKRWLIPGSKDAEGYVFIAARADGKVNEANRALTLRDLARSRRALQTTRTSPVPFAR
jgi:ABC-type bacteriocin/lantibiotic exporter with double-glycine peptidase domain